MTSLGSVQQEQLQVARALKTSALPKLTIPGRDGSGLMGAHPRFPPPPPPQYHPSHVVFPQSPVLPDSSEDRPGCTPEASPKPLEWTRLLLAENLKSSHEEHWFYPTGRTS